MSAGSALRPWMRIALGRRVLRPLLRVLIRNRRAVRNSDLWVIVIAAAIGVPVGMLVAILHGLVNLMHAAFFDLPAGVRLSAEVHASSLRMVFVPALGGVILGLTRYVMGRDRSADIVDPIEANALRGGDMSFKDSFRLLISTLTSNGSGASVGMEAGYTQIGASLFAVCGRFLRLRREDRRIFVTAGAAAAIAAAFDAPLAGIFYGFELVHGNYTVRALTPVALAALVATWIARAFGIVPLMLHIAPDGIPIAPWIYPAGLALGVGAAAIGIVTMKAASHIESALHSTQTPPWFRSIFAGVILGILAMGTPQVLGSGQGAVQFHFENQWDVAPLIVLLIAKIAASTICLGSGFRGGLFSSSLLIGCIYGATVSGLLDAVAPGIGSQDQILRLIGIAAVGASIIGAPLTMVFLILESTGDLGAAIAVLGGALAASTITRVRFGYFFATWRFHLRGLPVRGAYDIGWVKELTVNRLMRRDPVLVRTEERLAALRIAIPLGGAAQAFVVNANGQYVGVIQATALHDPAIEDGVAAIIAADLATGRDNFLTPDEDIEAVLRKFNLLRTEILPVVDTLKERRVVCYLTEGMALRRYAAQLERHRSAELGVPRFTD
jgi:CIC family chloride channel protein